MWCWRGWVKSGEQENITQNYESALEHTPEIFGQVCMLYVDTEVNSVPLKAFVDSGAQVSVETRR